mmetsp:Transcript_16120/g.43964  ORF Transcript_16120/g.43964 Transcript_16120/m.43964 type:complete len:236 (-) Transcript_16120:725-1432(-)
MASAVVPSVCEGWRWTCSASFVAAGSSFHIRSARARTYASYACQPHRAAAAGRRAAPPCTPPSPSAFCPWTKPCSACMLASACCPSLSAASPALTVDSLLPPAPAAAASFACVPLAPGKPDLSFSSASSSFSSSCSSSSPTSPSSARRAAPAASPPPCVEEVAPLLHSPLSLLCGADDAGAGVAAVGRWLWSGGGEGAAWLGSAGGVPRGMCCSGGSCLMEGRPPALRACSVPIA